MANVQAIKEASLFTRRLRSVISFIKAAPIFPGVILVIFVFCGIFAKVIEPHDPLQNKLMDSLTPPFWQAGGTTTYLLGTDQMGRDILSRLLSGATISLEVGFVVVFVAGSIGTIFALLAGFLGGWVDIIIMRLTDIMLSFPYLLIAIAIAAILGASITNVILILGLIGWAHYTRVIYGEVLRVKQGDFVRLAAVAGASKIRIMLRHIFPNVTNTLIVLATLNLGQVIITEASLSFIGVGVPPPNPAWGSMLSEGRNYITYAWWMCVWPGIAILLVVLSFNLLGDWLRVRLDPKFRQI